MAAWASRGHVTGDPTRFRPATFARTHPDRAAVITGAGRTVTYAELEAKSCRLAQALSADGLRPGDHVAVVLPNDHRTHEVAWGLQRSGLYYTMVNSHLAAEEAAYIVNDCGAQVLITSAALSALATELVPLTPGLTHRLSIGDTAVDGYDSYDDFIAAAEPVPLDTELEGSPMLYSSGTTGRPKGIRRPLTDKPFGSESTLGPMLTHLMGFAEGDVYLSPAPLYHSAPLVWSMTVHRLGGTVILMERFDPEDCLRLIAAAPGHACAVRPHHVRAPAEAARRSTGPPTTSSACAPSSMPRRPARPRSSGAMIDWWGPDHPRVLLGHRGRRPHLDELGGVAGPPRLRRQGHLGRGPRLRRRRRRARRPAQTASVCVRWPRPRVRVQQRPREDPPDLQRPAAGSTLWDIGHLDDEGYLYLTDRKLFMIVSGGVNIYPQEIEDVLVLHPAVADVAVFGVPEPEMGEEVKAVVQPVAGCRAGPELDGEIIAFCRDHLSHYKCPRTSTSPTRCRGARTASSTRRRCATPTGPVRPAQHHLNLGRGRTSAYQASTSATAAPKSKTSVIPTAETTGPMSRFPTPTVPAEPHHPQRHDPAPHVVVQRAPASSCSAP